MKILHDQKKIETAVANLQIHEKMNMDGLNFTILSYKKGELLHTPDRPSPYFIFCIQGHGRIYQLNDEGVLTPIAPLIPGTAIGDMEFVSGNFKATQYAEADSTMECLALDMRLYRERLNSDVLFLRFINQSLMQKMKAVSLNSNSAESLRIRVINYLMNSVEDGGNGGMIDGVGNATMFLRCSRRQLQRVLKELCEEGLLVREKKGCYSLTNSAKSPNTKEV